ncbi:MAG: L,D-transpeptidase [Schwartzia sp. (in: firmicutes)]
MMYLKVLAVWLFAMFCWGSAWHAAAAAEGEKITINLASRILTFYQDGKKKYMYHIGAGRVNTPTPIGTFAILSKEEDPEWVDPKDLKKRIASGEDNPLGYRWMEFKDGTYGIHGTNQPDSIGGYVSNGCVRMWEEDVEQLFDVVEIGIPVEIHYERLVIEETADGMMVYYIYPDGYGRQPLDVMEVREELEPYGLNGFLTDEEILEKMEAADGEPTYLGRIYRVFVDDRWISGRAIEREGIVYVPALPLSVVTKRKVVWDMVRGRAVTELGEVPGYAIGQKLFVRLQDVEKLFALQGALRFSERQLHLRTVTAPASLPHRAASGALGASPVESAVAQAVRSQGAAAEASREVPQEKGSRK